MSQEHAIALLRQVLAEATPNPETMRLLQAAWPRLTADEKAALLGLVGMPTDMEVGGWRDDAESHSKLLRQWRWMAGIAPDLPEPWAAAYSKLVEQFGEGDAEARDPYAARVQVGSPSPLDPNEIARLGPEGLVEWLRTWEPPPGRWLTPTPGGLASRMQEAVAEDPGPWIAALPDLIQGLHHPTYIRGLLSGLRDTVANGDPSIDWHRLLEAFRLVVSEPWPVEVLTDDPFDANRNWEESQREVMRLLERAFQQDADLDEEQLQLVWDLLLRLLDMRRDEPTHVLGQDEDLVMLAINKDSTIALQTMFFLALSSSRRDLDPTTWGRRLLEVVTSEMDHGGREGVLAGAITARFFPQFVHLAGEDALDLIPRLFGDPEQGELNVKLLEVLMMYARPITNDLLSRFYPHLVAYFRSTPAENGDAERSAVRWVLIGYLRRLTGQDDASQLVALLRDASRISEGAEFYGRVLREDEERTPEEINPALDFWDTVLAMDPPSESLKGFGWWSEGDAIPDEEWLPRMLATLRQAEGRLDWDDEVVVRLSRLADQPDAWEGLTLLVKGAEERWTVANWGGDLQKLLEASADSGEPIRSVRNDLIEALVERELLDFRRYRAEPPSEA